MIKLSVVIITHNEEKNIERCLLSVQTFADEIVVLDSFSNDHTEAICAKYNVIFLQHVFDGHIQQKNRAITHASHQHVLSLDADEALSETLIQSILNVKQNFENDGYYMNRLTNYCGHWVKHCGWYPDQKLRLWNKSKGEWTGQN
ncbi:MAG: glycosyltransferase family 2 protein, partial [Bacteroidota bacterium]